MANGKCVPLEENRSRDRSDKLLWHSNELNCPERLSPPGMSRFMWDINEANFNGHNDRGGSEDCSALLNGILLWDISTSNKSTGIVISFRREKTLFRDKFTKEIKKIVSFLYKICQN